MNERLRWVPIVVALSAAAAVVLIVRAPNDADPEGTRVPEIQEAPPVSFDQETETSLPRIQDTVGVALDPDLDPEPPNGFLPGPVTSDDVPD